MALATHRIAISFHIENDGRTKMESSEGNITRRRTRQKESQRKEESRFGGVRAKIGLTATEIAQFSGVSFIPITKYANKIQ